MSTSELVKFWQASNFNKGLVIASVLVLICVVVSLSQESFMLWHFPEATTGEYKSTKVKKFPAGFQDPNSIYIDHYQLPKNRKVHDGVYISNQFPFPPPAKVQDEPPLYDPPNPFKGLNLEKEEKEGYGGGASPFSMASRYGISPNFCSLGPDGKSCYAENCQDCQRAFEQDLPIGSSVRLKPSQQMYT
jgi:hypothetical protein